ncbi:unnamed protein product [Amoebophrya sp. A120]|nr:unnamed protein product [Amoebophrya sp. A120]|eukprot:GSA120T00000792001.1
MDFLLKLEDEEERFQRAEGEIGTKTEAAATAGETPDSALAVAARGGGAPAATSPTTASTGFEHQQKERNGAKNAGASGPSKSSASSTGFQGDPVPKIRAVFDRITERVDAMHALTAADEEKENASIVTGITSSTGGHVGIQQEQGDAGAEDDGKISKNTAEEVVDDQESPGAGTDQVARRSQSNFYFLSDADIMAQLLGSANDDVEVVVPEERNKNPACAPTASRAAAATEDGATGPDDLSLADGNEDGLASTEPIPLASPMASSTKSADDHLIPRHCAHFLDKLCFFSYLPEKIKKALLQEQIKDLPMGRKFTLHSEEVLPNFVYQFVLYKHSEKQVRMGWNWLYRNYDKICRTKDKSSQLPHWLVPYFKAGSLAGSSVTSSTPSTTIINPVTKLNSLLEKLNSWWYDRDRELECFLHEIKLQLTMHLRNLEQTRLLEREREKQKGSFYPGATDPTNTAGTAAIPIDSDPELSPDSLRRQEEAEQVLQAILQQQRNSWMARKSTGSPTTSSKDQPLSPIQLLEQNGGASASKKKTVRIQLEESDTSISETGTGGTSFIVSPDQELSNFHQELFNYNREGIHAHEQSVTSGEESGGQSSTLQQPDGIKPGTKSILRSATGLSNASSSTNGGKSSSSSTAASNFLATRGATSTSAAAGSAVGNQPQNASLKLSLLQSAKGTSKSSSSRQVDPDRSLGKMYKEFRKMQSDLESAFVHNQKPGANPTSTRNHGSSAAARAALHSGASTSSSSTTALNKGKGKHGKNPKQDQHLTPAEQILLAQDPSLVERDQSSYCGVQLELAEQSPSPTAKFLGTMIGGQHQSPSPSRKRSQDLRRKAALNTNQEFQTASIPERIQARAVKAQQYLKQQRSNHPNSGTTKLLKQSPLLKGSPLLQYGGMLNNSPGESHHLFGLAGVGTYGTSPGSEDQEDFYESQARLVADEEVRSFVDDLIEKKYNNVQRTFDTFHAATLSISADMAFSTVTFSTVACFAMQNHNQNRCDCDQAA